MPSVAQLKSFAFLAIALAAAGGDRALAQERCEGTFCDWYYGGSASSDPATPAKPAAPTPLTVASPQGVFKGLFSSNNPQTTTGQPAAGQAAAGQPAAASPTRIQVGGGGLAAMARGETNERCSGTLCDFYYGSSTPEPEEQAVAAPAPEPAAVSTPDTMDGRTRERIRFRQAEIEEAAKPRCTSTHADPWKCYR